jgi:ketosteroid isomerase-like protein
MNARSMSAFAARWADAWNRRAVDEVLDHFHDDVVFTSPTALAIVGSPVVRGKDALRAYWNKALAGIGSLRFTVDRALWNEEQRELAIIYTADINGRAKRVSENLTFDVRGKIVAAEVFHGIDGETRHP